ncbi:ATP-binding protein [Gillisia marina]|uniref:ATP-binding protein n=1 Tax=Gillisia marina TaxID=1167637 RepID=UPI00029AA2C3|nr:ATP-binding protein [Gillisia marina]
MYKKNAVEQLNNEARSLYELKSEPLLSTITDLTYWDKFVDYFDNLDHEWYDEDVASVIESFDIDYVAVYDLDARMLRNQKTANLKTEDFIPPYAFKLLHKEKFIKFHMIIPEGLVEVMGATVHPTDDPEKLETEPSGYFFISRLLNKEYTDNLAQISGASVYISEEMDIATQSATKNEPIAYIALENWNHEQISRLVFQRPTNIQFDTTKQLFYVILLAFFINLLLIIYFSKKWVYKPLRLITKILKKKDKKAIKNLKRVSGEFGDIGDLFELNNQQNEALLKAKNKAEESDRLKMAFLTNLSHEIRTPMNAILGFSELIDDSNLSKTERLEYIEIIQKSGKNLVLIIDDLIEMSKIDSAQIEPNYTSINLQNSLKEIYNAVKITIPRKEHIDFLLELPDIPFEKHVMIDITKLKQIITNLLTNAIKFTEHGFIKFGYTVDASKKRLIFTVVDSGQGIHKDDQISIFNRFRKLDKKSSEFKSGLGLGLAISKAYVEMMGGDLSLQSEIDKGSTFTFTLPLILDHLNEHIGENCPVSTVMYNNQLIGNILVAEDDNINFLLVDKLIRSKNHDVVRAVNGIEAVEKCSNMPEIDLVLMDIKMPEMDGFEAMKRIKLIRPHLPVIAHTAYVSEEIKSEITKAGFYGYIKKPLQKELLFNMMNEALLKFQKKIN